MKKTMLALSAALAFAATPAFAAKSCDDLKAEIAAKIEAKGIKAYTLEVVPAAEAGDRKVVGSCGGNTKKIVYKRGK